LLYERIVDYSTNIVTDNANIVFVYRTIIRFYTIVIIVNDVNVGCDWRTDVVSIHVVIVIDDGRWDINYWIVDRRGISIV